MEVPTQIELKPSETYTLMLPGLGTAGYLWTYAIEGKSNLVDISKTTADSTQPTDEFGMPIVGSSVDEVFTVQALEPGRVTIHFTQSRPWEKNKPPLKQHNLEDFIPFLTTD